MIFMFKVIVATSLMIMNCNCSFSVQTFGLDKQLPLNPMIQDCLTSPQITISRLPQKKNCYEMDKQSDTKTDLQKISIYHPSQPPDKHLGCRCSRQVMIRRRQNIGLTGVKCYDVEDWKDTTLETIDNDRCYNYCDGRFDGASSVLVNSFTSTTTIDLSSLLCEDPGWTRNVEETKIRYILETKLYDIDTLDNKIFISSRLISEDFCLLSLLSCNFYNGFFKWSSVSIIDYCPNSDPVIIDMQVIIKEDSPYLFLLSDKLAIVYTIMIPAPRLVCDGTDYYRTREGVMITGIKLMSFDNTSIELFDPFMSASLAFSNWVQLSLSQLESDSYRNRMFLICKDYNIELNSILNFRMIGFERIYVETLGTLGSDYSVYSEDRIISYKCRMVRAQRLLMGPSSDTYWRIMTPEGLMYYSSVLGRTSDVISVGLGTPESELVLSLDDDKFVGITRMGSIEYYNQRSFDTYDAPPDFKDIMIGQSMMFHAVKLSLTLNSESTRLTDEGREAISTWNDAVGKFIPSSSSTNYIETRGIFSLFEKVLISVGAVIGFLFLLALVVSLSICIYRGRTRREDSRMITSGYSKFQRDDTLYTQPYFERLTF